MLKTATADPLQWPNHKKISIVLNIALLSAAGQMASSMVAPSVGQITTEFKTDSLILAVLVVSVFLIGMAAGLLLTSGISEVYGRLVVIHSTNVLFVACACAVAASRSLGQVIGFRFLQGVAAAAPPAVGGGVIGDMFLPKDRGRATSIYGLGLLLGPMIGPVAGAYITQEAGWRRNCWIIAIVGAVMSLLTTLVLRETYGPLVRQRNEKRLQVKPGKSDQVAAIPHSRRRGMGFGTLAGSVVRPIKLLMTSPLVFLPALGLSVIFGIVFLVLSTMATVYQQVYGWSTGDSGLPYLGLGVGLLLGLGIYSVTADRGYRKLTKTIMTPAPELRLAPITLGSPLAAFGLIIYGWALEKQLHWIVPIVGCLLLCQGLVFFIMPVTTYLIDVFHAEAAGPVGAASVLRCLAGGLLPLCADKLYMSLGYGWGNTTLAFIALLFTPFPYLFYKNGKRLREGLAVVQ
ncbi:hypothetical protein M406DRAFT_64378 [Cryphonectria parasitica EP155]|uniref:Major facilitator superfamily (MFS) profile domain-containing protein n=1 Tax=Cryphonectria parasitica (strain ATCC 38755 / EP155) TaxID=660469 RepID=A0A9P4XZ71_CRYP1|nr:uncharacterized protein M406DRAFT_64378 [Cryphonectria parasitica EP155]KAF3764047.1 hypothetical protein M406DRAFT_64378 [Cryphonectria parasitica EP155]